MSEIERLQAEIELLREENDELRAREGSAKVALRKLLEWSGYPPSMPIMLVAAIKKEVGDEQD